MAEEIKYLSSVHSVEGIVFGTEINAKILRDPSLKKLVVCIKIPVRKCSKCLVSPPALSI